MVGPLFTPQHTPLAVTASPLSEVIFPPVIADDIVIAETALVVRTAGFRAFVENEISSPYAVPALLIA
jgi:hypothetical protein